MSTNLHNTDTTLSILSYYTSKFVSWWYRAYNSRPEYKHYHHTDPYNSRTEYKHYHHIDPYNSRPEYKHYHHTDPYNSRPEYKHYHHINLNVTQQQT
jgi:hypothetical protein